MRLLPSQGQPLAASRHAVAAPAAALLESGEASTAALAQKLIKAILGWMGSMVMIAWPGQLTQCYFLAFCFPCHLALYHTITQIRKKKKKQGRRT